MPINLFLASSLLYLISVSDNVFGCYTKLKTPVAANDSRFDQQYNSYSVKKDDFGLIFLGGGNENDPSKSSFVLKPDGQFCKPCESTDLPEGIYGAGAVRLDHGLLVCGGKRKGGKSGKCYYWSSMNKNYTPIGGPDLQLDPTSDGTLLMANNYLHPKFRNTVFAFEQGSGQVQMAKIEFKSGGMPEVNWRVVIVGKHSLPHNLPFRHPCMLALGNKLYILGGLDDHNMTLNKGWIISDNGHGEFQWEDHYLNLPKPVSQAGCAGDFMRTGEATQNALIWMAGGLDSTGSPMNEVWVADASNGKWLRSFNMKVAGTNAAVGILSTTSLSQQYVISCDKACTKVTVERFLFPKNQLLNTAFENVEQKGGNAAKLSLNGYASAHVPMDWLPSCQSGTGCSSSSIVGKPSLGIMSMIIWCFLILLTERKNRNHY